MHNYKIRVNMKLFATFATLVVFFHASNSKTIETHFPNTLAVKRFFKQHPITLETNDTEIYLPHVSGVIPYGNFINLAHLTSLKVGHGINHIEPGAFVGLDQLETLDLSRNNLALIVNGTFTGLANLQNLLLTGNSLTYIELQTFYPLGNLLYLNLDYNYPYRVITNNSFNGLFKLQKLHIEHTRVSVIEPKAFRGLESIRNISLDFSELKTIPYEIVGINTLKYLNIGHNKLEELDVKIITRFEQLETLSIVGNPVLCQNLLNAVKKSKSSGHLEIIEGCS